MIIKFFKRLFIDCFSFSKDRFELLFFETYCIPYKSNGFINEHWEYTSMDLIYRVNQYECIVLLNGKEMITIEFIHNMEYNCNHLFQLVRKFYIIY